MKQLFLRKPEHEVGFKLNRNSASATVAQQKKINLQWRIDTAMQKMIHDLDDKQINTLHRSSQHCRVAFL